MPHLAVGIPWNHQFIATEFLWDLIASDIPLKNSTDVSIIRGNEYMTAASRNDICVKALAAGADEILFLDTDQGMPSDVLARLRSHDKAIVSGLVPSRKWPHPFEMYEKKETAEGIRYLPIPVTSSLQKVDGVGFGCVLVQAEVIRKMDNPIFIDFWTEGAIKRSFGHDLYFCRSAQEAGYDIYVDTTCECTHDMPIRLNRKYAEQNVAYYLAEQKKEKEADSKIITPAQHNKELAHAKAR